MIGVFLGLRWYWWGRPDRAGPRRIDRQADAERHRYLARRGRRLRLGGVLIGLSAILVMALFGRIAGISGLTTGALPMHRDDWGWRLAFVAGLIAAPLLLLAVTGAPLQQAVPTDLFAMAIAGLLVGFGTVMGSGCTSGHRRSHFAGSA